jgi:hypothetical protein
MLNERRVNTEFYRDPSWVRKRGREGCAWRVWLERLESRDCEAGLLGRNDQSVGHVRSITTKNRISFLFCLMCRMFTMLIIRWLCHRLSTRPYVSGGRRQNCCKYICCQTSGYAGRCCLMRPIHKVRYQFRQLLVCIDGYAFALFALRQSLYCRLVLHNAVRRDRRFAFILVGGDEVEVLENLQHFKFGLHGLVV